MTLRFLASGDCLRSLSYSFRIGHSTISEIVVETCIAIFNRLSPIYLKKPDTNEWRKKAIDFSKIWNSPNCVGAGDGKHFSIQCPRKGGSEWFNYKGFHSMVLFAICDAHYRFTLIDLGAYGREGDASIFASSEISKDLENGSIGLPGPCKLTYSSMRIPHFFVMASLIRLYF